jgi:hypothetical protein
MEVWWRDIGGNGHDMDRENPTGQSPFSLHALSTISPQVVCTIEWEFQPEMVAAQRAKLPPSATCGRLGW